MTNEEERHAKFFLVQCVKRFQGDNLTPSTLIAKELVALAEHLLKENSELRVRDSNVTMHSLNVMAVNEDLVARLNALRPSELLSVLDSVEFVTNSHDGTAECASCGGTAPDINTARARGVTGYKYGRPGGDHREGCALAAAIRGLREDCRS